MIPQTTPLYAYLWWPGCTETAQAVVVGWTSDDTEGACYVPVLAVLDNAKPTGQPRASAYFGGQYVAYLTTRPLDRLEGESIRRRYVTARIDDRP